MWSLPSRANASPLLIASLALGLGAFACTGETVADGKSGDVGGPSRGGGPGSEPVDMERAKTEPIDPGRVDIHRLSSAEYNATVADVLGTRLQPATATWRGGELAGFDNMAAVLGVDADQYQRYFEAAEALVEDVFQSDALRSRIVTCSTPDDACIKHILDATGTRIFRRPLTAEEQATYARVYASAQAQGDDHDACVSLMVRALLSSAEFLYRIEVDPNPASTDKHPLSAYELASRLSYFLWSSAPDDQLLNAARDDTLVQDGVLSQAVDYMLGDPKSNRLVSNFAGQWLGARRVIDHPTSTEVYPSWSTEVAVAAAEEMYLYFNEFLRSGRSWLEFMKADVNFVNPALAAHYGMPAPASTGMVRVEHVGDRRAGFVGLAGFLAMSSPDRRTSPTLRGKWLLMNMMCTTPPDPPPNIPELEDAKGEPGSLNVRAALEEHRSNPACAGCHSLFDPFGLALEQFDGIGQYRAAYSDGSTIDPTTQLNDGSTMSGLDGAAETITKSPKFATCISEKMLTYALGRVLNDNDRPYLQVVNEEWLKAGATPSVARLVQGLVATETFRYRRGG